MISMMRHFMHGTSLNAESLALDVIHQVGPGGDFLTTNHTLKHFRKLWQPVLFSRQRADGWIATGSKRLGQRLREKTLSILEEHEPELLPNSVQEEIAYILEND